MKVFKLLEMTKGWFIGDFEPVVFKTPLFEMGILFFKKNQFHNAHFHKIAFEINVLLQGKIQIQEKIINKGDIFTFQPYEVSNACFLEDSRVLVIKIPSVKKDKFLVNDKYF